MNNKDQEIVRLLESGHNYTDIQLALKVSPSRISKVKKQFIKEQDALGSLPAIQNSSKFNGSNINSSPGSSTVGFSKENGSKTVDDQPSTEIKMRKRTLLPNSEDANGQNAGLNSIKTIEEIWIEKKRVENEERALVLKERELNLLEDQLKLKKEEAEKMMTAFVNRLRSVIFDYELEDLSENQVQVLKAEATTLREECKSLTFRNDDANVKSLIDTLLLSMLEFFNNVRSKMVNNKIEGPLYYHMGKLFNVRETFMRSNHFLR
jgi:hypothetical protein